MAGLGKIVIFTPPSVIFTRSVEIQAFCSRRRKFSGSPPRCGEDGGFEVERGWQG